MMDSHQFDLDAYAKRIEYGGHFEPTLAVLRDIQRLHVSHIPFENLDVLLGRAISLRPEDLEQKLVKDQRGGYCFEQNGLMLGILNQIGFTVTPLAGRVRLESPRDFLPPRTHLFLAVEVDQQEWIFDAGVGGSSLTSPIRRTLDEEQMTPHETRRITFEDGTFFHQALMGTNWVDVYEFTGEPMPEIDREVSNWWTSTSPNARFSQRLMAALAEENGVRKAILNDRFLWRQGATILEETKIESASHLLLILAEEFNLRFPPDTRFGSGKKPWPTI